MDRNREGVDGCEASYTMISPLIMVTRLPRANVGRFMVLDQADGDEASRFPFIVGWAMGRCNMGSISIV